MLVEEDGDWVIVGWWILEAVGVGSIDCCCWGVEALSPSSSGSESESSSQPMVSSVDSVAPEVGLALDTRWGCLYD